MNRRWLFTALALLTILVSTGIVQAQSGNRGRSNFDWIVARDVTIRDDLIVSDATTLFDTTVTGALTVEGGTASNDLTASDFFNIIPAGTITLTMNGWLTPTGSLQPIAAAGAVALAGGTKIATTTEYLILYNVGAQTITFTETTGLISAGNIALGAGDSATLVRVGTNWVQVGASNN